MASVTQSPAKYNAAYIPNVYVLGSLGGADKYVITVEIGPGTFTPIATFKQSPNPDGVGIFDVQRVLQSYLDLKPRATGTTPFLAEIEEGSRTEDNALTYRVRYGTETGGSITYDGYAATKYVFNVYDNWRNIAWDYTPFIPEAVAGASCVAGDVLATFEQEYRYLTNYPITKLSEETSQPAIYQPVRLDDWRTLSFHTRISNFDDGTNWGNGAGCAFVVKITHYDESASVIGTYYYSLSNATGLNVRTDCNDQTPTWPQDDLLVGTIGAGPENLKDAGYWPLTDPAFYEIQIYSPDNCQWASGNIPDCNAIGSSTAYLQDVVYSAIYYLDNPCTKFDPIQIAFMNQYGVLDYTTWDRRNTKTVNTQRNNYYKVLGSWSDSSFSIDPQGRGQTVYSSQITTEVTASSYWMTDAESLWLQELFTSPQAYIYVDGIWEPIVIQTQVYDEKTIAREKMFRYSMTFTYSNQKTVQRG